MIYKVVHIWVLDMLCSSTSPTTDIFFPLPGFSDSLSPIASSTACHLDRQLLGKWFGSHPEILRNYSWLWIQDLLLVVLRGPPYGILNPGWLHAEHFLPPILTLDPWQAHLRICLAVEVWVSCFQSYLFCDLNLAMPSVFPDPLDLFSPLLLIQFSPPPAFFPSILWGQGWSRHISFQTCIFQSNFSIYHI